MSPALEPVRWHPPAPPKLEGPYEANSKLVVLEQWWTGGVGPEDVAVDDDGNVYTGLEDGRILRFGPEGGEPELVVDTGGRPLGIEVDAAGRLIVCDADRGLLRVEGDTVETLVDSFEGEPLLLVNNAAVASDGTIYFSVSSTRFRLDDYRLDLAEHSATGRLFAHHPDSGETRLLLDGLCFANGVALDQEETFVLVAETGRYRITRRWLTGDRAGQAEPFIDNLPGFPDNLSRGPTGIFWLALPTPRNRPLDALAPYPRLRKLVMGLPERFQPQPARFGFVLGLSEDGEVAHNLQDPSGSFSLVTGLREHEGWLYLGSLTETSIARVSAPRPEGPYA